MLRTKVAVVAAAITTLLPLGMVASPAQADGPSAIYVKTPCGPQQKVVAGEHKRMLGLRFVPGAHRTGRLTAGAWGVSKGDVVTLQKMTVDGWTDVKSKAAKHRGLVAVAFAPVAGGQWRTELSYGAGEVCTSATLSAPGGQ